MKISDFVVTTNRPYSLLSNEITIFDKPFLSKQLPFGMQAQTQTNWCWAATATSVSQFYWLSSTWTQCGVANSELERGDCCSSSVPSSCNVPWYLDRALSRTDNFVRITGQVSFQQVRDEIDAGRPIGARIAWDGGGGHFMVIYGYGLVEEEEYIDIDDPIYGKSHLSISEFSTNYQGSGTWSHSYFTKNVFKMPIETLVPSDPILRRIWEVRPLLSLKKNILRTGDVRNLLPEKNATIGIAHRIYVLALSSLNPEQDPSPRGVGIRVYEMEGDKPSAFFDVSEEEEPRLLQLSDSQNYLDLFAQGLAEVLTYVEREERKCELRFLRVPALNFEALWINYEDNSKDILVPLRALTGLPQFNVVPLSAALNVLREASRPLLHMDETMGA